MIELRIYRAAFVPALLAAVLAAFSLQSRPAPLDQGLAADVVLFDGAQAAKGARQIVGAARDRRPGHGGDLLTGARVRASLRGNGFSVRTDRFDEGDRHLANVVGRRAGRSTRQIVVIAPRDAFSVPDASGSASDTAALLELGQALGARPSRKTLVLASVDGSTMGEVGTDRLAGQLRDDGPVDAVVTLSDLGARAGGGKSRIVPWSGDSTRAGIGLERTVADSIRAEGAQPGPDTGVLGQLARIGIPVGVGAQGVLLQHGFDATRISGSGELPPGGTADIDSDRLGLLGRTALRTVSALDAAPRAPGRGPKTYVTVVSQVLPGWALAFLALTLILPALVASVDAFARARRQREAVGRWARWLAAGAVPFAAVLVLAKLLALVALTPEPPEAAVAPAFFPLDGPALGVLAGLTVVFALLWLALRSLSLRGPRGLPGTDAAGAGCALALAVSVAALLLWLMNPYAALLVVPAVHLWILATLTDPTPARRARLAMVGAGALPIVLVGLYYLLRLSLDPLHGAWYLLLLLIGGQVGVFTVLLAVAFVALFVSTLALAARPDEPVPESERPPSVRGPLGYAGPGSLGGTDSALRR